MKQVSSHYVDLMARTVSGGFCTAACFFLLQVLRKRSFSNRILTTRQSICIRDGCTRQSSRSSTAKRPIILQLPRRRVHHAWPPIVNQISIQRGNPDRGLEPCGYLCELGQSRWRWRRDIFLRRLFRLQDSKRRTGLSFPYFIDEFRRHW